MHDAVGFGNVEQALEVQVQSTDHPDAGPSPAQLSPVSSHRKNVARSPGWARRRSDFADTQSRAGFALRSREQTEFAAVFLNGKTPLEIAEQNFQQNLYLRGAFVVLIFGASLELAMMAVHGQKSALFSPVMSTKTSIIIISTLTLLVGFAGCFGTFQVSWELSLYRFMIAEAKRDHIEKTKPEKGLPPRLELRSVDFPLIDPDTMETTRSKWLASKKSSRNLNELSVDALRAAAGQKNKRQQGDSSIANYRQVLVAIAICILD